MTPGRDQFICAKCGEAADEDEKPACCPHCGWDGLNFNEVGSDNGPYGDKVERLAASLWRKENPDMSVFACDAAMMEAYRLRILEAQKKDG